MNTRPPALRTPGCWPRRSCCLLTIMRDSASVHENEAAGTAHALVLAAQVLPPSPRPQVVEPVRLQVLLVVLRVACAAPLQVYDVSAPAAHELQKGL